MIVFEIVMVGEIVLVLSVGEIVSGLLVGEIVLPLLVGLMYGTVALVVKYVAAVNVMTLLSGPWKF